MALSRPEATGVTLLMLSPLSVMQASLVCQRVTLVIVMIDEGQSELQGHPAGSGFLTGCVSAGFGAIIQSCSGFADDTAHRENFMSLSCNHFAKSPEM